jgi:hypothetical protein
MQSTPEPDIGKTIQEVVHNIYRKMSYAATKRAQAQAQAQELQVCPFRAGAHSN